jgi:hypothetical protein
MTLKVMPKTLSSAITFPILRQLDSWIKLYLKPVIVRLGGLLLSLLLFWLVVLSYSEGSGYVFSNLPVISLSSLE